VSLLTRSRRAVRESLRHVKSVVDLPCKAGCWGCCRGEVELWDVETRRLKPLVTQAALGLLKEQGKDADPYTAMCPLLDPDTKMCTVYAERPLVCRAYVVVSPADFCYPERVGSHDVHQVQEPLKALVRAVNRRGETTLRQWLWSLIPEAE